MFRDLEGKTIVKVDYTAPDMAGAVSDNETIILHFSDGTKFKIWSWGYALDTKWIVEAD